MNKDLLIVLSGGMDSTTLLYDKQDRIGLAVSFNYGSKHNDKEIPFAAISCEKLGIEHVVIDLQKAMEGFKSDLLKTGGDVPEGWYDQDNMASTVVPFRNGIMLSIAAGLAESRELSGLMLASHAGDHAQYPDCRADFTDSMKDAIYLGTSNNVKLLAPYNIISKREIAEIGDKLNIPWEDTWSCYKGEEIHCGRCGTCTERLEALDGLTDGTNYADTSYWKEARDEAQRSE